MVLVVVVHHVMVRHWQNTLGSEICGANHAFMPIVVKAVNLDVWSIIWGPISCAYTCIFQ